MPAVWTEPSIVTNLLRGGSFWSGSTITFGFPTTVPSWADASEAAGFSALSAAQKTAATLALGIWDEFISPSLVLTTVSPQITLQNGFDNSATPFFAYTYPVGNPALGYGSVWFNRLYTVHKEFKLSG